MRQRCMNPSEIPSVKSTLYIFKLYQRSGMILAENPMACKPESNFVSLLPLYW